MIKKFFYATGVMVLICFSFYYTDMAVDIVKRNDPIMKQIVEVSNFYTKEATDAVVSDLGIIPGISGMMVDIDKSYEKMRQYGSFDEGLLVFGEVVPTVSSSNTYDKFIISGNPSKNGVSLLFTLVDDFYIDEIINILNSKNVHVTFFLEDSLIKNNSLLKKIIETGNDIELLSSDYLSKEIKAVNNILKMYDKKINYCYYDKIGTINNNCKNNKLYSFVPSIIPDSFPYSDIKNNIVNGSIISLDNDSSTVRELSSIINYLNQKGYKILLLEDLLNE